MLSFSAVVADDATAVGSIADAFAMHVVIAVVAICCDCLCGCCCCWKL
jgi:hypothetical protein